MGLLDDAIREHLELKRRNGADPAEVARLEREALGPARRGPEPLEVAPQADAPAPMEPAEPAPPDARAEAPAHDEPEARGAAFADEPEPEVAAPEPAAEAPPAEAPPAVTPAEDQRASEEPPPADDVTAQPTVAFDAADLEEATGRRVPPPRQEEPPPADEEEDVLEETPDFLQETPEHDRLWFEQRPPRDFDFDG